MAKRFNPKTIRTLYAPRFEYTAKSFSGDTQHYTGLYFPTEPKARKAAENLMTDYPGQFCGYEIITTSADLSSLFDTYAKALSDGTVEN